jgi:hypothetical protein
MALLERILKRILEGLLRIIMPRDSRGSGVFETYLGSQCVFVFIISLFLTRSVVQLIIVSV